MISAEQLQNPQPLNRMLRHPALDKAVVAIAEKFYEFHIAEFLELLANFGLNVGVVRMELRE